MPAITYRPTLEIRKFTNSFFQANQFSYLIVDDSFWNGGVVCDLVSASFKYKQWVRSSWDAATWDQRFASITWHRHTQKIPSILRLSVYIYVAVLLTTRKRAFAATQSRCWHPASVVFFPLASTDEANDYRDYAPLSLTSFLPPHLLLASSLLLCFLSVAKTFRPTAIKILRIHNEELFFFFIFSLLLMTPPPFPTLFFLLHRHKDIRKEEFLAAKSPLLFDRHFSWSFEQ